jgi:hypothetical protein
MMSFSGWEENCATISIALSLEKLSAKPSHTKSGDTVPQTAAIFFLPHSKRQLKDYIEKVKF